MPPAPILAGRQARSEEILLGFVKTDLMPIDAGDVLPDQAPHDVIDGCRSDFVVSSN